jgi:hypothetical protein
MSQDIRVMVPRVRRALDVDSTVLSDDQIKDLIADALGALILYSGSAFGRTLTATEFDAEIPTEYAIDPELPLPEQTAVAAQAALDYFFHRFSGLKISEHIGDEATTWEYQRSATLLRDQFKQLVDARDKALEAIAAQGVALDSYVSFLAVRDPYVSALIEPFLSGAIGGQELLGCG